MREDLGLVPTLPPGNSPLLGLLPVGISAAGGPQPQPGSGTTGDDQRPTPVPASQECPYPVSWLKDVRWFSALGCLCQKGKADSSLSESAFMGASCIF